MSKMTNPSDMSGNQSFSQPVNQASASNLTCGPLLPTTSTAPVPGAPPSVPAPPITAPSAVPVETLSPPSTTTHAVTNTGPSPDSESLPQTQHTSRRALNTFLRPDINDGRYDNFVLEQSKSNTFSA